MRLFECPKSRRRLRLFGASVALLLVSTSAMPGSADLKQELEKLRQQQQQVQAQKKEKAAEVDATTAQADELTSALEVLTASVNEQAARVSDAQQQLEAAQARHDAAVEAVLQQGSLITDLETKLQTTAINSFVTRDDTRSPIFDGVDPNKAVRMQSLTEAVTESGVSVADQLRNAKEDLQIEQVEATAAEQEAADLTTQLAAELTELETRQQAQEDMLDQAEERLEQALAESAALADLDKQLADKIVTTNAELARQAAARKRNPAPVGRHRRLPLGGRHRAGTGVLGPQEHRLQPRFDAGGGRGRRDPFRGWRLPQLPEPDRAAQGPLRVEPVRHLPDAGVAVQPADGPTGPVDARAGPGHRLHLQRGHHRQPFQRRLSVAGGPRPEVRLRQPAVRALALVGERQVTLRRRGAESGRRRLDASMAAGESVAPGDGG